MYNLYEVTFRSGEVECVRLVLAEGICRAIEEACHDFYLSCGLMALDYEPVKAVKVPEETV